MSKMSFLSPSLFLYIRSFSLVRLTIDRALNLSLSSKSKGKEKEKGLSKPMGCSSLSISAQLWYMATVENPAGAQEICSVLFFSFLLFSVVLCSYTRFSRNLLSFFLTRKGTYVQRKWQEKETRKRKWTSFFPSSFLTRVLFILSVYSFSFALLVFLSFNLRFYLFSLYILFLCSFGLSLIESVSCLFLLLA